MRRWNRKKALKAVIFKSQHPKRYISRELFISPSWFRRFDVTGGLPRREEGHVINILK
jgi:hypothetical protein